MTEAFLIQNQNEQFLDKSGEWTDRAENNAVYRTVHKDEAINVKVEQSVRNPELRLQIVTCILNERGQLRLPEVSNDSSAPLVDSNESHLFSLVNESVNNHSQHNEDTENT